MAQQSLSSPGRPLRAALLGLLLTAPLFLSAVPAIAAAKGAAAARPMSLLQYRKEYVSPERYETAGVFDVNNDGVPDIVSGAFWYPGPTYRVRHKIGAVMVHEDYFDDFSTIPLDVNGDGRMDFITGGFWGNTLRWRENPGVPGKEWPEHVIAQTGPVETTRAWDVDGDGQMEIVPNTPGKPLVVYRLVRDAQGKGTGKFEACTLRLKGRANDRQGHGLGCGDINGDGRPDFVLNNGWLEAPADPLRGEWLWHPEFKLLGSVSIPVLVADVNGDGRADLIQGNGHGYGLWWWEQGVDAAGQRTWKSHEIDPYNAQYHDLQWVDLDRDGKPELVTGKRFRAHPGSDPGDADAFGWYIFKWTGEGFVKHVVDFGPVGTGKGLGIFFAVADLNGDGWLDIVAPGKEGLAIYYHTDPR